MPARKTYEEVKAIFEDAKCRLNSKEYVNGSEPLEYYCHCGNEEIVTISLQNFTKHGIAKCPKCPGHRPFPKKLKYDDVKAIFANKGCVLLSKTYISNKKPLQYKCNCGNEEVCELNLMSFQLHGTNCEKCRDTRMRATNQERFGVDYVNQREGPVKERAMAGFMKHIEEKKHKYDDVKVNFESKGLKLLETEYVSNVTPMKYECMTCGNCSVIKYDGLYNSGNGCNSNNCMDIKKRCTNLKLFEYEYMLQNPIEHAKHKKKCYKSKIYTFKSGKTYYVQGNEDIALDILLTKYNEDDIKLIETEKPEIWYIENGKYHRYFCDIWLPKHNLIIEVKSTYIYNLHYLNTNNKRKACEYLGYKFKLMLFDNNKNIIN